VFGSLGMVITKLFSCIPAVDCASSSDIIDCASSSVPALTVNHPPTIMADTGEGAVPKEYPEFPGEKLSKRCAPGVRRAPFIFLFTSSTAKWELAGVRALRLCDERKRVRGRRTGLPAATCPRVTHSTSHRITTSADGRAPVIPVIVRHSAAGAVDPARAAAVKENKNKTMVFYHSTTIRQAPPIAWQAPRTRPPRHASCISHVTTSLHPSTLIFPCLPFSHPLLATTEKQIPMTHEHERANANSEYKKRIKAAQQAETKAKKDAAKAAVAAAAPKKAGLGHCSPPYCCASKRIQVVDSQVTNHPDTRE
jgi:hypothetical protein